MVSDGLVASNSDVPPTPITACGTVITTPGTYIFAADLSCAGPGIEIRTSNVTILSRGHGIEPAQTGISAGVGVPGGVSHIRLIGVDVRNSSPAILFENVSASTIQLATVWFGGGIQIRGTPELSRNDTIMHSDLEVNSPNDILVSGGTGMVITGNRIEDVGACGTGVNVIDGHHNMVRDNLLLGLCTALSVTGADNVIADNTFNGGVPVLLVGGRRNLVLHNQVRGVPEASAGLRDVGSYNTFRSNTILDTGVGFEGLGSHALFEGNTVQSTQQGVWLVGGYNIVRRNNVSNNTDVGIGVGGLYNTVVGNTALGNAGFDLRGECGTNQWRENTFETASNPCIH